MADTPVSPTNVTALPTAPNRNTQTNPLTYSQTADAWAGALPTWTTQVNNIAANVNFNADSAFDSAAEALASKNAAEAAEAAAIAATNATQWVSGQAYDAGDVVYSPINFLSYRANTNTSGTTDPSLSANWTPLNEVDLSTDAVGTLPVANGGTGATTLTANNVLLGNGTSAVQFVAPGSSGNVLTSNGTTWASATPSGGSDLQEFSTSGTWTKPAGATFVMVEAWGGGGGGGSGQSGAAGTERWGGTGGGGGAYTCRLLKASDLPASVLVTVGAGGTGGASITASNTSGNSGTSGSNSQFGQFLIAYRGASGSGGLSASDGGVGGGVLGISGQPAIATGNNLTNGTFQGAFGAGFGGVGSGAARTYSSGFGGGSGGGNANKSATMTNPSAGGSSYQGGAGGGGGSNINTSNSILGPAAGGSRTDDSGGGGATGYYGKAGHAPAAFFGGGGGRGSETISSLSFTEMAYGDSKFVAMSSGIAIICVSSDDGATWTQQAAVSIGSFSKIYYLNNQWVLTSGSVIATSTDLTSWSISVAPATINGLEFNSGTYVMVSTLGQIYTSTDLIQFIQQSSGTTQTLNSVIHDGTRWIIVGNNGVSLTSTNATSWTLVTTTSSGNWARVASSGSVIVATSSTTPFAWRSTDGGASWSQVSTTLTSNGRIIYAGSKFVNATASSNLYTSTDGDTWTTETDGTTDAYGSIAYSGTTYAIASNTSNSNAAITSPTGVTWTARTFASVTYPATAGGNGGIAAGGGGGAAILNGTTGGSGAGGAGGNGLVRVYTW